MALSNVNWCLPTPPLRLGVGEQRRQPEHLFHPALPARVAPEEIIPILTLAS